METKIKTDQKIISYLTFKLDKEIYALNVSKVINIVEKLKITKIPNAPEYLKGVINLRGEALPVIDTRLKLNMGETVWTDKTCILILEAEIDDGYVKFGALVDSVQEVLEFEDEELLDPPSIGNNYRTNFITGVVRNDDDFIMILEIEKLFDTFEMKELQQVNTEE